MGVNGTMRWVRGNSSARTRLAYGPYTGSQCFIKKKIDFSYKNALLCFKGLFLKEPYGLLL